jgi:hypothetical protein
LSSIQAGDNGEDDKRSRRIGARNPESECQSGNDLHDRARGKQEIRRREIALDQEGGERFEVEEMRHALIGEHAAHEEELDAGGRFRS